MKAVNFGLPTSSLDLWSNGLSFGGILLCVLIERICRTMDHFGPIPEVANTTAKAVLSAAGTPPPEVDAGFIASALSAVKGGASAAWNFVPSSTKLVIAAALAYWAWRKWKGDSSGGVHIQNTSTNKVEIHLHGSGPSPEISEKTRKEKDGTSTTVVDMTFCGKEEQKKTIVVVPSWLFRKLLFSSAI